jgi:hypothetical protein
MMCKATICNEHIRSPRSLRYMCFTTALLYFRRPENDYPSMYVTRHVIYHLIRNWHAKSDRGKSMVSLKQLRRFEIVFSNDQTLCMVPADTRLREIYAHKNPTVGLT